MRQHAILIHILAIETGLQAHLVRAAAEHWGASVTVTWAGNSAQVVEDLSNEPNADVIILSAHGDGRGLLLPELAEEIKPLYPYNEVIRPADFADFLQLRGSIVLNAGCRGGTPEMAEAFLSHGAGAYIGPTEDPDAAASSKYLIDFLYAFCYGDADVKQAHWAASAHEDDRRQFQIYTRVGADDSGIITTAETITWRI